MSKLDVLHDTSSSLASLVGDYDTLLDNHTNSNTSNISDINSDKNSDQSSNDNRSDNHTTDSTKVFDQPIEEILLPPKIKRRTILPVIHHDLWKMYKEHEAAIWHAHEVKLQNDLADWNKMTKDEQHFVKYVLAFFASSDLIVAENIVHRFSKDVQLIEAQTFYAFQVAMENIHSEVYANMIMTYITDKAEQEFILMAVENIPCIKSKAQWAQKWIDNQVVSFAERLVAFACVEGIFFSGAFCCIYWLTEGGRMPGLGLGNDFIARDEGRHTDFACLLYKKYIKHKLSQQVVEQIVRDAVDIEINFITEALPCKLIGMNATHMKEYIKYVANRLVQQLGHQPIYYNQNRTLVAMPFPFMDRIGLTNKSNFFERDPTEYSKAAAHTSTHDPYDDIEW
jgi:ribonucleotide reductase beta subunit family protein with ferritin-like domain